MDYKNQINIINQAVKDTQYLKDVYKPSKGLVKVISTWFCMYIFSKVGFNFINELQIKYKLYNYDWYYPIFDSLIIIVSLFILFLIVTFMNSKDISFKERDILKFWLIFPFLFSIIEMLPVLSILLNSELVSLFYSAFPLTLLITLVMVVFIYSQYKYKELKIIIVANCILIALVFTIMSLILNLSEVTDLQTDLIILFNEILSYKIFEILIIFLTLSILKRKQDVKQ